MKIINRKALDRFKQKHPPSRKPLRVWEIMVTQSNYADFNDLRKTFAKADYTASGYTIFDIGGHKYRLITQIDYRFKVIEIKVVWTHNEYSHPKNVHNLKQGNL